jgi:hypothetical protein
VSRQTVLNESRFHGIELENHTYGIPLQFPFNSVSIPFHSNLHFLPSDETCIARRSARWSLGWPPCGSDIPNRRGQFERAGEICEGQGGGEHGYVRRCRYLLVQFRLLKVVWLDDSSEQEEQQPDVHCVVCLVCVLPSLVGARCRQGDDFDDERRRNGLCIPGRKWLLRKDIVSLRRWTKCLLLYLGTCMESDMGRQ